MQMDCYFLVACPIVHTKKFILKIWGCYFIVKLNQTLALVTKIFLSHY